MKIAFYVAAAIVIDIPEEGLPVGATVVNGPLDELAARLRREARYGRDSAKPAFTQPKMAACMVAACQEFSGQN